MRKFTLIAIGLLLTAPAFGETVGEKTGVNSVLGISPTTADFVKEAAQGDMFEIQSSELAAQRSDDATKAFANQMIADHQKTSDQLKATVQSGTVKAAIPAAMDSSHQKMMEELKSLSGADFTKKYHDDQVSAHKDAVSLFQRYAKGGENSALKQWAGETLPNLQHHLEMAQNLDK